MKANRIKLVLAIAAVSIGALQSQTASWFTGGGSKISFSKSGTPPKWSANWTNIYNLEGTNAMSSVTDANGRLIFCTDGLNLYTLPGPPFSTGYSNRTAPQFGNQLLGTPSATQSALILPLNDNGNTCKSFLVFTTVNLDEAPNNANGLGISLVTATLNANGYYNVAANNTAIQSTSLFNNNLFSEKLCATEDGAGGYWVAAHDYNPTLYSGLGGGTFYLFHVANNLFSTSNGDFNTIASNLITNLNGSGTISTQSGVLTQIIGEQHRFNSALGNTHYAAKGQMKFNRNGSKLALVLVGSENTNTIPSSITSIVEVYNFDKNNGELSSPINGTNTPQTYDFSYASNPSYGFHTVQGYSPLYGLEFAPNFSNTAASDFLYVSESKYDPNVPNNIYQCRLSITTPTPVIVKTATPALGSYAGSPVFGDMQLGLDNKIYIVKYGYDQLAYIPFPDAAHNPTSGNGSSCGYLYSNFTIPALNGIFTTTKLPTMIMLKPSCSEAPLQFTPQTCNCGG
jgi:hypothetical protein